MTTTILTPEQINEIRLNSLYEWAGTEEPWQIFAKHIEQAVLQSPEVQQMRKDAERYRWLRNQESPASFWPIPGLVTEDWQATPQELDSAIDAAMEKKE